MKISTRVLLMYLVLSAFVSSAASVKREKKFYPVSYSSSQRPVAFNPFFTSNFSGGLPSGWIISDSSGNGIKWHYTNSGAANGSDSLSTSGTTASNGYMIFDSDSSGGSVGGENSDLISDTIDCSAHSNVHLNFNEFLVHFNDTATVWVSSDGTAWTMFHNSSAGLAMYEGTSNPHNVDVDISSVAANQSTVFIRFNYRADYSYYWMIDDVKLYQAPSQEAAIAGIAAPSTSCTLLSSSEDVTIKIYNSGGDTINSGLSAGYMIDGGSAVTESVSTAILSGDTLTYTFTAQADLSAPGDHNITAFVHLTNDTIASNDSLVSTFHNGPYPVNTFVNYNNGFEPGDDLSGYSTEDGNLDGVTWSLSNLFPHNGNYCMQLGSVTASDWLFTTCLDLDASLVYKLSYFYRTNSTSSQARYEIKIGQAQTSGSMTQEIFPSTLISNIFYLPGQHQIDVPASGIYYIGFHVVNGDSAVTGFRLDDINIVPDSGVGITILTGREFSIFPNPSNGIIHIDYPQLKENLRIEVINSVGQLFYESSQRRVNNEIDLSNAPGGIYLVRIIGPDGLIEKKISILN